MSEREFTFNRRVVADQEVYVTASSLAEAWRKARAHDVDDAGDQTIVRTTYRRKEPVHDHPRKPSRD